MGGVPDCRDPLTRRWARQTSRISTTPPIHVRAFRTPAVLRPARQAARAPLTTTSPVTWWVAWVSTSPRAAGCTVRECQRPARLEQKVEVDVAGTRMIIATSSPGTRCTDVLYRPLVQLGPAGSGKTMLARGFRRVAIGAGPLEVRVRRRRRGPIDSLDRRRAPSREERHRGSDGGSAYLRITAL